MPILFARVSNSQFNIISFAASVSNNNASVSISFASQNNSIKLKTPITILQNKKIIFSGIITKMCAERNIGCDRIQTISAHSQLSSLAWYCTDYCYSSDLETALKNILQLQAHSWSKITINILHNTQQYLWAERDMLTTWQRLCDINNLFISICCTTRKLFICDNLKTLNQMLHTDNLTCELIEGHDVNISDTFVLIKNSDNTRFTIQTINSNLRVLQSIKLQFFDGQNKDLMITKIISHNQLESGDYVDIIIHTIFLTEKITHRPRTSFCYGMYYKANSQHEILFSKQMPTRMSALYGTDYYHESSEARLLSRLESGIEVICAYDNITPPVIIGTTASSYAPFNLSARINFSWRYNNGLVFECSNLAENRFIFFGVQSAYNKLQANSITHKAKAIISDMHNMRTTSKRCKYAAVNSLQLLSKLQIKITCKSFIGKTQSLQVVSDKFNRISRSIQSSLLSLDCIADQAKITTNDFAIKTNNILTNSSNNHISAQMLAINVGASSIIFSPGSISCNGLVINIKVAAKNIVIP